jgi:hypothetical protein
VAAPHKAKMTAACPEFLVIMDPAASEFWRNTASTTTSIQ